MSEKNTLTKGDWGKWGRNFFIFSIPTIVAVLTALQNILIHGRVDERVLLVVAGAAYQAFLASMIDLVMKYKKGV